MNTNEIIQSAIVLSQKYNSSAQTEQLRELADAIRQDKLKVVVLGDFKAGKSTLLNRLFLRKDMLPTDYLEATAVPTHLNNGMMGMSTWMRGMDGKEVLVNERSFLTHADIVSTVTAHTEEGRANMATRYSRVNITMPGILPDNITLVDTPGLNTPNTAIYCGTLAEARTADAIIYVVRGKQLSQRELSLITDLAGTQCLKVPVHVVLTHTDKDSTQLQAISQEIKARLQLVGLSCGVSCFSLADNQKAETSVAEKIDTSYSSGEMFGGTESVELEPVTSSVGNIESELLAFFNVEVRQGRNARLARELKPILHTLKVAVESRLALSGAKNEEIKLIEARKAEIKREYLRVVENLLLDVRTAQASFCDNVVTDLDELRKDYEKELDRKERASDILSTISDWQDDIPTRMERALSKRKIELQRDIDVISLKHQQELIRGLAPERVETEMPSDWATKMVTFMPKWLLQVSDYLIFDFISPLPLFMDVVVRMIAEQIPGIRDIMPSYIVANVARNLAKRKLKECIDSIKNQVTEQLDVKFNAFNEKLSSSLSGADIFAEQDAAIAEVRKGLLSPAQQAQLKSEMEQVERWNLNI